MRRHSISIILLLCSFHSHFQIFAQTPPRSWSAADIMKGIERLSVVGSVLYVAAHPDDENTAFLATMANGYGVRAAYLSLTRGEGGQNLIGPEQGGILGMIRSQELLAARRIDGAHQYFTRAIDFGYSKTTDETLSLWGKESILSDVVFVTRMFRPDVIVTRFTPDRGGHGNHTSSALLAIEAFSAAGDPGRFPEHLQYASVWQPVRIVWNAFRFGQTGPVEDVEGALRVDLGAFDPLLGVSYSELAGRARSMHKSQGFGASEFRGEYLNTFEHVDGSPAVSDLFEGVDLTWKKYPGGGKVLEHLDKLRSGFSAHDPAASISALFRVRNAMASLPAEPAVRAKIGEVENLILACGGVWVDSYADRHTFVRGDTAAITLHVVNRSSWKVSVESWQVGGTPVRLADDPLLRNRPFTAERSVVLRADAPYTQPSWLREPASDFTYTLRDQQTVGRAEDPPVFMASVTLASPEGSLRVERPVRFRTVDPVNGETYLPLRVVPRVAASLSDELYVVPDGGIREATVHVKANAPVEMVTIAFSLPQGWTIEPPGATLSSLNAAEARALPVRLSRSKQARTGVLRVGGSADGEPVSHSMQEVRYDHIPPLTLLRPAAAKLIAADIRVSGGRVGYVMGAGDEIPAGLRQLGYDVDVLSDADIQSADLSVYPVIVAGVRAYNTRPVLTTAAHRLDEYMRKGGTFIVQYLTTGRSGPTTIGPYPLKVGRDRVTDERAAMTMLVPAHAIFTTPNRITRDDFDGWVQERGLYFAQEWDDRYTPLLACADPGEESTSGSLLVARVGTGAFIYTGLSFFRQIPAGVPGAYRLLVNLLSYRTEP